MLSEAKHLVHCLRGSAKIDPNSSLRSNDIRVKRQLKQLQRLRRRIDDLSQRLA